MFILKLGSISNASAHPKVTSVRGGLGRVWGAAETKAAGSLCPTGRLVPCRHLTPSVTDPSGDFVVCLVNRKLGPLICEVSWFLNIGN